MLQPRFRCLGRGPQQCRLLMASSAHDQDRIVMPERPPPPPPPPLTSSNTLPLPVPAQGARTRTASSRSARSASAARWPRMAAPSPSGERLALVLHRIGCLGGPSSHLHGAASTCPDKQPRPRRNEVIPMGSLNMAGDPKMLVEVFADKLGKGGRAHTQRVGQLAALQGGAGGPFAHCASVRPAVPQLPALAGNAYW